MNAMWTRIWCGRTHQIRVHMAFIGYPLVGDKVYGGMEPALFEFCPRQALHARFLTFRHPQTGEVVTFEAPLPPDMAALLEHLRGGLAPAPPPTS